MTGSVLRPAGPEYETSSWKRSISPRLLLAAAITGTVSGLVCVGLRFLLWFLQWLFTGHNGLLASAASQLPWWRRALTPVLGALVATLITRAASAFSAPNSFIDYVDAVRHHNGHIPFLSTLRKTAASFCSVASGAAVGREGSMIQFAASAISVWGQKWKPRCISIRRLVALGAAGAVASVYQAPVAGAFFALEIVLGTCVQDRASLQELPALLTAAASGGVMSHYLLGPGPLFPVGSAIHFHAVDCAPIAIGAIAIGVLGPAYFRLIKAARFLRRWPLAIVWSGALVGAFSCLRPEVWGNGDSGVLEAMTGRLTVEAAVTLLALRLFATAACVGSGVPGGVFTPTVFTGSVLGLLWGHSLQLLLPSTSGPISYAVLGIGCLLASVTHAPFMAAFMTVELTGTLEWFPLALVCTITSWQIAKAIKPYSLYTAATPEPAVTAETGKVDAGV